MQAGALRVTIGLAGIRLAGVRLAGVALAGMVLAGSGAVLAGCGSSDPPAPPRTPAATIAQMKAAVNAASSVHLDGVLNSGGKAVALNIGLRRSGEFSGTITDNGLPLTLIDTGGKAYVKATPEFLKRLKVSGALCSIMCGKFVELTTAQSSALAGNLTMRNLLGSLTGTLPKFADAGTTTVRGQQAQVLRAPDGSMLDVAATGTPYPLRAIGKKSNSRLDFTQWNSVPRPVAPPPSQVINVAGLR